jgi:hypothetical protein
MINFENWQSTGLLVVARTAKGRWCGSAQCWGDEVARKGVVCVHIDNTLVNTNNTWLNIDNTSVNEGTQSSSFHHSCREPKPLKIGKKLHHLFPEQLRLFCLQVFEASTRQSMRLTALSNNIGE